MRLGAVWPLFVALLAGCWDWDGLAELHDPGADLGVDLAVPDLRPSCDRDAFDPCAGRDCGEVQDPCGQPVVCGACPGVCGGGDAGANVCSCDDGGRLPVDRLGVDVQAGPEGWYQCYQPAKPPVPGDPRDPSPCESGVFAPQEQGAFYVYPAPGGAGSGLVPLYWCSLSTRHFLSTDPTCADLEQDNLVQTGILGYIATSAVCGAVPLHRLAEVAFDNDRAYLVSQKDIDSAMATPSGYDDGASYVDKGVIGYVWTSP